MLYIPKHGERGLLQLELTYKSTTIGLQKYLALNQDWMLRLVNSHKRGKEHLIKTVKSFHKRSILKQMFWKELSRKYNQKWSRPKVSVV